jgi:tetratricopeptide (TPR) repeat protein
MLLITFMAQSLVGPSGMNDAWKSVGLGAALIVLITVGAYIPAMRAGFIWDDDAYVTNNGALRSLDGLRKIWVEPKGGLGYYPLTYTGFWVEYHLWKLRPLGYHLANVLLHAANAVLVWLILRRLKIPGAWVAGLVFAIHPVNVATVAWISELKNTLSMLFYAVAILLYLRFDEEGRWRWCGLSLAAFLLALLSKPAVVILPAVLLSCIWWRRGQVRWKDFLRSVPYFVLSLALGWVSMWVESWLNRQAIVRAAGFFPRLAGAGWAAWFYLYKALLPLNLTVIYPKWEIDVYHWVSFMPGIALAGCFGLFWWKRQTWGRPLLFGLAYFVTALFPVLGFFDIGFFSHSLVADHWQYYSIVAPIALAAAGWELIYRRMGERGRYWGTVAGVAVLMVLGAGTWSRAGIYVGSETLWQDNVARNPNAWTAHNNLGIALFQAGRVQEAIVHFDQALRIRPHYAEAQYNLGHTLSQVGKFEEAIGHYEQALLLKPDDAEAHNDLGTCLSRLGKVQEAIAHHEQALRIKPDYAAAHYNLGIALKQAGRIPEAIEHLEQALRIKPDYAAAHYNLGTTLGQAGRIPEAIEHLEQALRIKPDYAEAHYNLGMALVQVGRMPEAIEHLEQALRLKPDFTQAQNALARLQAR